MNTPEIPPHDVPRDDCCLCTQWCFCHVGGRDWNLDHEYCVELWEHEAAIRNLGLDDLEIIEARLYQNSTLATLLHSLLFWTECAELGWTDRIVLDATFNRMPAVRDRIIAYSSVRETYTVGEIITLARVLRVLRVVPKNLDGWTAAESVSSAVMQRFPVTMRSLNRAIDCVPVVASSGWMNRSGIPPLPSSIRLRYPTVVDQMQKEGVRRTWSRRHLEDCLMPLARLASTSWVPDDDLVLICWMRAAMLETERIRHTDTVRFLNVVGEQPMTVNGIDYWISDPVAVMEATVKESIDAGMTPELFLSLNQLRNS